jgi:predicted transcriptional regulator
MDLKGADWMRRNDLDICADILQVAKTGAKKTQIVYQANLNFKIVKRYLNRLISTGMLSTVEERRLYTTTNRGMRFLEQYNELVIPIKMF